MSASSSAAAPAPKAGNAANNANKALATASGLHADTINKVNSRGMPYAPFVTNVDDFVGGQQAGIEGIMRSFEEMSAKYRYMEVNLQQKRKGLEVKIPDIKKTLDVVRFLEERRCKQLGTETTKLPRGEKKKRNGAQNEAVAGSSANDKDAFSSDDESTDDEEGEAADEEELEDEEDLDDLDDEVDDVEHEDDDADTTTAAQDKKTKKRGRPLPPLRTLYELNDTLYSEAEVEEDGTVGLWLGANTMLLYPLSEAILLLADRLRGAKRSLRHTVKDLEFLREQVTVMEVNFARVHNWDVKRRRDLKQKEQRGIGQVKSLKEEDEED